MPKEFTQFGERVISSFNNKINHSLLWLTIFYTTIIVILLSISSSITYSTFNNQINHRFKNHPVMIENRIAPSPTAKDVTSDLIEALIIVNGVLIFLSAILSYLLAKNTLKPIEESYENQQRFLSNASHELRTPLSILFANLENQIADALDSKEKEIAISNLEEVQRMNKIINDLLVLSKFDENKSELAIDNIDLIDLINNIIKRLQPTADLNKIYLNFKTEYDNLFLKSDQDLLNYAITNIIKNAINYNKPSGKVDIEIKDTKKEIEIKIIDTGIGITPKDLNQIFNRFYRADKSRSRQTGGSGLGLSITKEAVDKLGGSIKVESKLEFGTEVILKFYKV